MKSLHDVATPCAVIDLDRLERNCTDMIERAVRLGVGLRPHVKTHKCVEIAKLQVGNGPMRLTVSTLAEASWFARAGFGDLTWAVPLSPSRIEEALDVAERCSDLHLVLDHEAVREMLDRAASRRALRASVFLKVDCGYHRAGVDPADPASLDLAGRIADSSGLTLAGILTHAGHAYACKAPPRIRTVAAEERDVMAEFAAKLRGHGLDVPVVSVGSTPTVRLSDDWTGVDELRPGNYVFFDRFQHAIGACTSDDIAFFVLGTVIGAYPARGSIVLDTGGTALSHDPGPRHVDPDCGYGRIRSLDGGEIVPAVRITGLSQEHARVDLPSGMSDRFRVGDRLRVVPNHSCMAAGLFDRYLVARGTAVVDTWRPAKYWSASNPAAT